MALAAGDWLAVWERGRTRHPLDRALLLYALAARDAPPHTLADAPLGRLNAALLEFRRAEFGGRLPAYLDCPSCGQRLEFELDVAGLCDPRAAPPPDVSVDGQLFRPPTPRDLAAVAQETDAAVAAERLLRACRLSTGTGAADAPALPPIERVESALETADPDADIRLALACEACGHAWAAPFDVSAVLWEEIEARAGRLLDEIHLLARAYGWSEAEILSLSDARRGAYLERVGT